MICGLGMEIAGSNSTGPTRKSVLGNRYSQHSHFTENTAAGSSGATAQSHGDSFTAVSFLHPVLRHDSVPAGAKDRKGMKRAATPRLESSLRAFLCNPNRTNRTNRPQRNMPSQLQEPIRISLNQSESVCFHVSRSAMMWTAQDSNVQNVPNVQI